MKFLLGIDAAVFALLRRLIAVVDTVIPFNEKRLAITLFAIYMISDISRGVLYRTVLYTVFWAALLILVIVPQIENMARSQTRHAEHNVIACVFRLVILAVFLTFAVTCVGDRDVLGSIASTSYTLLVYVIDMDRSGPSSRRRLWNLIQDVLVRPGWSTAFAKTL